MRRWHLRPAQPAPPGAAMRWVCPGPPQGVVLWSVRRRLERGYTCVRAARRRAELVASGGGNLYPGRQQAEVAGNFAAFVLTTSLSENENLVVFDFMRGRRELTHYLGCFGSRACAFAAADELTQYALAGNGWVAEVWKLAAAYGQFAVSVCDRRPDDGGHRRRRQLLLDRFRLEHSRRWLRPDNTLTWTSDLGGASSVELGSAVVPSCRAATAAPVPAADGERRRAGAGLDHELDQSGRLHVHEQRQTRR